MTDNTQHVLVWSCGPVQEFIKAGRKGRDLWFGSWLLSEMSRAAARAAHHAGATLVHPAPRNLAELNDEHFNVSNKLLVLSNSPRALAKKMEEASREHLSTIFRQVRGQIGKVQERFSGLTIHWNVAAAQVEDLPEFYWASAPVSGDFGKARQVAEAMHAGAKAHRSFQQPPWTIGAGVPKSSLDGARESVVDEKVYGWKEKDGTVHPPNKAALKALKLQGKERLCGVGLLKRWGAETRTPDQSGGHVLSTSHVASWTTRKTWHEATALVPGMKADFEVYVQTLRELKAELSRTPQPDPVLGREDGHVLFENRLVDVLEEENLEAGRKALRQLFAAWKDRVKAHNETLPEKEKTRLLPPTPYYAVLVADGDKVGKALDVLSKQANGVAQLQRFTQVLEKFANAAAGLVQKHHGHAVYTGGDDVLALLPVETALECTVALKELFAEAMAGFGNWTKIGADVPTLSAGICIAHHTDPLQHSLDYARKAETTAKQKHGRNAWCVILAKRSGAPLELGGKWEVAKAAPEATPGKSGKKSATYADLEALVALYKEEVLPRGLPYDLREAGLALKDLADGEAKKAGEEKDYSMLRAAEAKRILLQKSIVKRTAFEKYEPHSLVAQSQTGDLEGLAQRLLLARFLVQPEEDRA